MKENIKRYMIGTLLIALLMSVCFISGYRSAKIVIVGQSADQATLVTAAHIPESELQDYDLIYTDYDKDIAIYRSLKHTVPKPEVNEKVTITGGITGIVSEVDDTGFTIRVDDFNEIVYGQSGVSVTDSIGHYIGFISYLSGKSEVYCISY